MKPSFQFLTAVLLSASLQAHAGEACQESAHGEKDGQDLLVLVNKDPANQLKPNWVPTDLQKIPEKFMSPRTDSNQLLRKDALAAFTRMHDDAAKAGVKLFIQSGYRSFNNQCGTFASKVKKWTDAFDSKSEGMDYARKSSAEPGRSQHQLGTTVDIVFPSMDYKFSFAMAKTDSMKWLEAHAQEYGFAMSYPYADDDHDGKGYNKETGYFYEPWHWRYIGVDNAQEFELSGQLLDDFIEVKVK